MASDNKIYSFKSYNYYAKKRVNKEKKVNLKPALGAAVGVSCAMLGFSKLKNNQNSVLYKFMNLLHLKEGGKKTFKDVSEMITMAGCANIGAVGLNSIGKTKEQKRKKRKEAAFQIMNMALPMLMVTAYLKICEASKVLNKVPTKIIASIIGMTSGAYFATKITNSVKKENEPKRKYTIKDSVANFDDVVATIKLGFSEVERYIPVSKILPFIYIYSASRAGAKGDEDIT